VSRKEDELFAASKVDGAILHEKCMIRDGFLECPGVAVVVERHLGPARRCERRVPLSPITGQIDERNGRHRLALGVKNSDPWRSVFRQTVAT